MMGVPLGYETGAYRNGYAPPDANAHTKARELLRSKLNDVQRKCFDRWRFFFITKAEREYKVEERGVSFWDGEKRYDLCIAPANKHEMPIWDTMLALKLAIETDEEEFLKTANKFPA